MLATYTPAPAAAYAAGCAGRDESAQIDRPTDLAPDPERERRGARREVASLGAAEVHLGVVRAGAVGPEDDGAERRPLAADEERRAGHHVHAVLGGQRRERIEPSGPPARGRAWRRGPARSR
jgi:hypothetical protein